MSTPANILNADLLIKVPEAFPLVRLWRSNRIEATAVGRGGKLRRISAGVDGQGDLSGIIGPRGIRLEVETKTTDRQSVAQKGFEKMIVDAGGCYILCRSVDQCLEELGRWA